MTDYQRIEQVLKYHGLSARALALAIDLKSPQIFYDIKANKCGISKELATKIQERFLDISAAWLLTGEGSMLKDDSGASKPDAFSLPYLDIDAAAGFSDVETTGGNMRFYTMPRCDAAMPVRGRSMEPYIHDGDIAAFVMLPSAASIRPDGIYIVQYVDDESFTHITVKRAKQSPLGSGYIRLAADNPEYGCEDIPLSAITRVALV